MSVVVDEVLRHGYWRIRATQGEGLVVSFLAPCDSDRYDAAGMWRRVHVEGLYHREPTYFEHTFTPEEVQAGRDYLGLTAYWLAEAWLARGGRVGA